MYEMLTGAPPFFSKNRKEVFDNILTVRSLTKAETTSNEAIFLQLSN